MAEAPATTTVTTGADAPVVVAPATDARPSVLPEKFKTVEDLVKSYTELEKKLGAPKPKDALQIPTDPPVPELGDDAGVDALLSRANLTEAAVAAVWKEKGELTAEMYAAFRKQGVTKTMANDYLTTKSQLGEMVGSQMLKAAHDKVGGEAQFNNLLGWAKTSLSAADKEWYDAQVGQPATSAKAVEWLIAAHATALRAGKAQPLVTGGGTPQAQGAYTSSAEISKVILSPEYRADPAVRERHQQRLKLTDMRIIQTLK